MHRCVYFILLIFSANLYGQSGSEIYLFDLSIDINGVRISNPKNITQHPGYDNQPCFYENGKKILFTSMEGDDQTNIYSHHLKSGKTKKVLNTSVSEYSPTPIGKGKYFNCVVVEENGDQRLWKYKANGKERSLVFKNINFVGYHCRIDQHRMGLFILGDPNTLQIGNKATGNSLYATEKIGRSIHMIPGQELLAFVHKEDSTHWMIKSLDPNSLAIKDIIDTLPGSEDFCLTSDGTILMGRGNSLYKYNTKTDVDWSKVADLADYGIKTDCNRLAISADNKKLAIVVLE